MQVRGRKPLETFKVNGIPKVLIWKGGEFDSHSKNLKKGR
jgi:hypothetical protein